MHHDRLIWFQTDNHLLQFDGDTTIVIPARHRIASSSLIGGEVYLGFEDGNLAKLRDGMLQPVQGTEILAGKKIKAIVPFGNKLILATPFDGLFTLDDESVAPLQSDINDFLKENQLFCATAHNDVYVFGTVSCGAVVKNFSTGATSYINKESGMQNNTILSADFDRSGNIWFSLDNGIDYGIYNSPVHNLVSSSNDIGAGYTCFKNGNNIYFGTNQGLYVASYPFVSSPSRLDLTRCLPGQIWSLDDAGGGSFFVGGDAGAFHIAGTSVTPIEGLAGTYCIVRLPNRPDMAIASTYDGFKLLQQNTGSWHVAAHIDGDSGVRGHFIIDSDYNLWVNHWVKGVYKLHLDLDNNSFDNLRLFTQADGLPATSDNMVSLFRNRAVITNPGGFFSLNKNSGQLEPDPELTAIFPDPHPSTLLNSEGNLTVITPSGLYFGLKDSIGNYTSDFIPVKGLRDRLVVGYEHASFLGPDEIIISNQNGFWSTDPQSATNEIEDSKPFVSNIYANSDRRVFRAALSPDETEVLNLPYELNSLRFEFASPDYRSDENVQFSSMLENYDRSWSPYTNEAVREYTQLAEGSYVLRLRAINLQSGHEDETEFHFHISPPWYRSIFASIIYVLLLACVVAASVFLINRWKRNAEKRMERRKEEEMDVMRTEAQKEALRKDYEIANLKSEQLEEDIKHKSNELSSATMNVIRKNEILQDIASKISKIQTAPGVDNSLVKQLAHIQTVIQDNISHDDDLATFNHNFDVVYGNFTTRLHQTYPHLTPADVRLCCYIKMGLSSKEIAPLINISFKSVEMARYRLRKKLELTPNTSLTEFLANF